MTLAPPTISAESIDPTDWDSLESYYEELRLRSIDRSNVLQWLHDWSELDRLVSEAATRISIRKLLDTNDKEREQAFLDFNAEIRPQVSLADNKLKEKLLALDLRDEDYPDIALMLKQMRTDASIFREENVPLETEIRVHGNAYDKITGGLAADWDGEKKNLNQLRVFLSDKDRAVRRRAWQAEMDLWLGQRSVLNDLYGDMLSLRRRIAENAGSANYRDYIFKSYLRFDYTPDDCFTFHRAIEEAAVPVATRILEKRRAKLGLKSLRPWDLDVETSDAPPLKPYDGQDQFVQRSLNIFQHVDPVLARHFSEMAERELLDLETRPGKGLGGFCASLEVLRVPYIFMNGAGTADDVRTMLHEAGHAFHTFEAQDIDLIWQTDSPMEFAEVASMSMELLSAPYLAHEFGGYYTAEEARRARIDHLEGIVTFLPYMAVVDAFQHWVYTHPDSAADPANCDAAWDDLWARFMTVVDWSGLEESRSSGWHRKLHIFQVPFYYVEYGMAQMGALQVWRNALDDQAAAVASYRQALALGGKRGLSQLFAAAGAEFRFDPELMGQLMALIEDQIAALEA